MRMSAASRNVQRGIMLSYYNRVLLGYKIITNEEYQRMEDLIYAKYMASLRR